MQFSFNKKTFTIPTIPFKFNSFEEVRITLFNIAKLLTNIIQSLTQLRVVGDNPPSAKTSTGVAGQLESDGDYLYLCIASGNWIRFTKDGTY
jgi:hypothetical protein